MVVPINHCKSLCLYLYITVNCKSLWLYPGLIKDHGQQARASENFAGPVDFENLQAQQNFHCPWPVGRGLS